MEKIKFEYKVPENVNAFADGVSIVVIPFLDAGTQAGLISRYIKDLFDTEGEILVKGVEKHRFNAELSQMLCILEANTNIDIKDVNENLFFNSKLWENITEAITNYWEFRDLQTRIVNDYEQQIEKLTSTGFVLSGLMDKLSTFVDSLAELTPESIASLQETGKTLIEQLEKSKVVQDMERGAK